MCVIVFKPAGAECPTMDVLESCWTTNPDGAGMAVSEKNSVFMRKGFMKFSELADFCKNNKVSSRTGQAIMFHFRIGTHGLKDAGNTHPFPISADPVMLRQLTGRHDCVVAHNGIFSNTVTLPKVSDTGQFIADCAGEGGDPVDYWNKHPAVHGWSRLLVMRSQNRYTLLGDWHCKTDSPCMFSNLNWKVKEYVKPTGAGCGYFGRGSFESYGCGYGYGSDDGDSWNYQSGETHLEWNSHLRLWQKRKNADQVTKPGKAEQKDTGADTVIVTDGGIATAWVGGVGIRQLKSETYMEWRCRVVFAEEALAVTRSRAGADEAVGKAEKKAAAAIKSAQDGVAATIAAAKSALTGSNKTVTVTVK